MIEWTDKAIEAALDASYQAGGMATAEDMRAALNAAVKAQGQREFCDSCYQCGMADGRAKALEEAAKEAEHCADAVSIRHAAAYVLLGLVLSRAIIAVIKWIGEMP